MKFENPQFAAIVIIPHVCADVIPTQTSEQALDYLRQRAEIWKDEAESDIDLANATEQELNDLLNKITNGDGVTICTIGTIEEHLFNPVSTTPDDIAIKALTKKRLDPYFAALVEIKPGFNLQEFIAYLRVNNVQITDQEVYSYWMP